MTTELKIYKALVCINTIVFTFSITMAWFCLVGIKYSEISNATLITIAISQLIISAYSAYVTVLYEKRIERIKRKLNK